MSEVPEMDALGRSRLRKGKRGGGGGDGVYL